MRIRSPHTQRESGFSMFEVVIAVVIMGIVAVTASDVFMRSQSVQTRAKIQQRQSAVAEAAFAALRTNPQWGSLASCKTALASGESCDISSEVPSVAQLTGSSDSSNYTVQAIASGIDTAIDGSGTADADALEGDCVQVQLTVSYDGATRHQVKPLVARSAMRPTGTVAAGTVVINVCTIWPQVDEGTSFTSCERERSIALSGSALSDSDHPAHQQAMMSAPESLLKTTIAPAAGVTVQLKPGGKGPKGAATPQTAVTDSSGRATFPAVPVGAYDVTYSGVSTQFEKWPSHSRPATGTLNVSSGSEAAGIIALRPTVRSDVEVTMVPDEVVEPWELSPTTSAEMHLVPLPLGRDDATSAANTTTVKVSGGKSATRLRFDDVSPGLYAAYLVSVTGEPVIALDNVERFIWVGVNGEVSPASPTANSFTSGVCSMQTGPRKIA